MGDAGLSLATQTAGERFAKVLAPATIALLAVLALVAGLLATAVGGDDPAAEAATPADASLAAATPTTAAAATPDGEPAPVAAHDDGEAEPERQEPSAEPAAGELVVAYRPGTSPAEADALERDLGLRVRAGGDDVGYRLVEVPVGREEEVAARLRARGDVAFVERPVPARPAQVFETEPTDPRWFPHWGQVTVGLPATWARSTGDADVTIAVVDTGVDVDHADFRGRVLPGRDVWRNTSIVSDTHGHGTKSALAAVADGDNRTGLAGSCWGCRLLPVKVAREDNRMWSSEVARGIDWAARQGADIISVSVVIDVDRTDVAKAVRDATAAGALVVAAAGNDDATAPQWPAAYPEALAVGGSSVGDARWRQQLFDGSWMGSNHGPWVDVAAPYCTMVAYPTVEDEYGFCGTSSATPLTAGAAGIALALAPELGPAELRAAFETTAAPVSGDWVQDGRVDVPAAIRSVIGRPAWWAPFPPPAPTVTGATAGEASATVTWTYGGDVPVERFVVTAEPDAIPVVVSGSARNATVAGLRPGVGYRFRVRADGPVLDGESASAPSATVVPTFPAVRGVQARARDGEVEVIWTALTEHAGLVTGYRVVLVDSSDGTTQEQIVGPGVDRATFPATNGRRYTAAVTALGDGDLSGPASPAATAAIPLGVPDVTLATSRPVDRGHLVSLVATVRHGAGGTPVADLPVVLERRDGTAWTEVDHGVTDAGGRVPFTRDPGPATDYRVVAVATPSWEAATSAVVGVAASAVRAAPDEPATVAPPRERTPAPGGASTRPVRPRGGS